MALPKFVKIVEVGPRDGLQNEPLIMPTELKVAFINKLSQTGLPVIETTSFVSPQWVPQMADSRQVLQSILRHPEVSYPVLVPNWKGFENALDAGSEEICVFGSASETFSRHNIHCTIDESFERFEPVCSAALAKGVRIRGYISCTLGCPYEGPVAFSSTVRVAKRLRELGCYEIALADTIGVGTPGKARALLEEVAAEISIDRLAVHFHDTYGQALANIYAVLELGVAVVDSSVAGLGGCPYAPAATGNVATEDVIYMLNGLGIETHVDLDQLVDVGWFICSALGRSPFSKVSLATKAARLRDASRSQMVMLEKF